jgi:hypothetical protein
MRLLSSLTIGSLSAVLLCTGALVWGAVGCGDAGGGWASGGGGAPTDEQISANPETVTIDTGATLSSPGGGGVGVFVQYAAGGHWSITTGCDTATSGQPCGFDIFVAGLDPSTTLSNPVGSSLAPGDGIDVQSDGSYHLSTLTTTAIEGMTFDATAGGTIAVEMFLDGAPQPRFVYWIGGQVLHTGAPTDPINLQPSAP